MPKILKNLIGIFAGLLGLTFVITIHEFGHFIACKIFNVSTPVFSIGFDPEIFGYDLVLFYKYIGSTKFQIAALPLGGYVSINPIDFASRAYLPKMIIILAGIVINILFAFLVFYFLYKRNKQKTKEPENNFIDLNRETDDELFDIERRPERELKRPKIIDFLLKSTPEKAKIEMAKQKSGLIGPIGIVSLMSKSFYLGFDTFIYFVALISLNVGIFNILPIPFFDGGQALNITLEALRGKTLSEGFSSIAYYLFLLLLVIFTIYIAIKDIIRLKNSKEE